MKIIVDRNIRAAGATFGRHADLVFMDGREIAGRHLVDADALIIRTATRVDRDLLEGSRVGFVGTTSIGTDHLDTGYLESAGLAWANAPGCNADSAAQYTLAMIWLACRRLGRDPGKQRVGIIGRGNVGSRVQRLLQSLGADTLANDPPLEERGERGLAPLAEVLDRDIVCLHVPLTGEGPYPTLCLMDRQRLAQMPDGALLLNTARGDVVDGAALMAEVRSGRLHAALDVWPGEPLFPGELLGAATVATPHVAGYSNDGKWKGTAMVYEAFCRWSGVTPVAFEAPEAGDELTVADAGPRTLETALEAACFVPRHDRAMRALAGLAERDRAAGFDRLRRDYPARRDFQAWRVDCSHPETAQLMENIGFFVRRV